MAGGRALRTQGSSGSRRTSNFLELPGKFLGDEAFGVILWLGEFSDLPGNFPGDGINYDYCRKY